MMYRDNREATNVSWLPEIVMGEGMPHKPSTQPRGGSVGTTKSLSYVASTLILLALTSVRSIAADAPAGSAAPTTKPGQVGEWTVRGHVPPEKFVIQSHRGAGELA